MNRATEESRVTNTEGKSPEAALFGCPQDGWRRRLFIIIFESDTHAGRLFDLALLLVIVASVAAVMLDSVIATPDSRGLFAPLEALFTLLFTVEYIARLLCVERPLRYARSFFGIVDLLAVLPTYLAFFVPEAYALVDVRVLRLLRVFRILKLTAYIREYRILLRALLASGRKIFIFISAVAIVVVVMGTIMYVVEGPGNGYTSIPISIYWAITTITTVGFGDITPQTDLGRAISSFMMLLGWGILAVPTGIVTAEMAATRLESGLADKRANRLCASCGSSDHRLTARFCQECGAELPGPSDTP